MVQKRREWAKFVYVDEAGFNLHLTKVKSGWAIVGSTPEIQVPRDKQRNVYWIASLIPSKSY